MEVHPYRVREVDEKWVEDVARYISTHDSLFLLTREVDAKLSQVQQCRQTTE